MFAVREDSDLNEVFTGAIAEGNNVKSINCSITDYGYFISQVEWFLSFMQPCFLGLVMYVNSRKMTFDR